MKKTGRASEFTPVTQFNFRSGASNSEFGLGRIRDAEIQPWLGRSVQKYRAQSPAFRLHGCELGYSLKAKLISLFPDIARKHTVPVQHIKFGKTNGLE